jgi:hypothetical protein
LPGEPLGCGQRRLGGHFAAADRALNFWRPTPTTKDRGLLFPAAAWLTRAVQPGRSRVVVLGASLAGLFAALQFAPKAPPIKAAQRIRGLRLTATDVDWTTGNGPPVEGTGEALLMALAGRPAALPELSGRGVQTLAERIAA